jgi:hypothetical protein
MEGNDEDIEKIREVRPESNTKSIVATIITTTTTTTKYSRIQITVDRFRPQVTIKANY